MFFCRELCKLPLPHWYFDWQPARSNCQPPGTTCSLQLRICVSVSVENCITSFLALKLLFKLKLSLTWNITRLVKLELFCHANDNGRQIHFKQQRQILINSKLKPQHILFSLNEMVFSRPFFYHEKSFFDILSNIYNFRNGKRNLKRKLHKETCHWREQLHKNLIPNIQFTKLLLHLRYRSNL